MLPPPFTNSCKADNTSEFLLIFNSTIYSFQNIGPFCICGDLNARCGTLSDICVVGRSPDRRQAVIGCQTYSEICSAGMCTVSYVVNFVLK